MGAPASGDHLPTPRCPVTLVFFRRLAPFRVALAVFLSSRASSPVASPAPSLVLAAAAAFPAPAGVLRWAFSGSRRPGFVARVAGAVASALPAAPSVPLVSVGCAGGADAAVRFARAACPGLSVFRVAGPGRGALAARSAACVRSVLPVGGGCLVACPASPCPAGVAPRRAFRGRGSGSWGSVGLALGLGLPVVLFVPPGASLAAWAGPLARRFALAASGPWGAWAVAAAVPPPPSLFGPGGF